MEHPHKKRGSNLISEGETSAAGRFCRRSLAIRSHAQQHFPRLSRPRSRAHRNTPFGVIICDIMVNELAAVLGELGGEAGVGRAVRTSQDLSAAIREGFPHEALNALTSTGLSLQEVASSLDLSLRSLQRRKSQGRLARYESDRLYRLARLVSLAANFLGDRKVAIDWLKRPNHALGGVAPLAIIDTELGARQVENVLGRIGYGGVS